MPVQELEPPSYETARRECRIIPLIVQMHHHAPGRFLDGDNDEKSLMSAGRLLATQGDAVLLPTTITYEEALTLLHQRVLARAALVAPSKVLRFFCRLAIVAHEQLVLLEKGSWVAARELLRYREGVDLVFIFSVVPRRYTGDGLVGFLRRKLNGGSDVEKICLVEPAFQIVES